MTKSVEECVVQGQVWAFEEIAGSCVVVLRNGENRLRVPASFFPDGEEGARRFLGRWVTVTKKVEVQ